MTPQQMAMAFQILFNEDEPHEALRRYCTLADRMLEIERDLESVTGALRYELIAALFRKYPAAAKRIMAGKPPRRRKRRTAP
jgi:hypothetical protein